MRKRVAIHGASDETLRLLPLLAANPEIEVACVFDPDLPGARARLRASAPEASSAERLLTDDPAALSGAGELYAVIDAGATPDFASRFPEAARTGVQIVAPLTARLLWGYGAAARDRKNELLSALREVVESVDLAVDPDELFARMLEMAIGVTGAEGGSLLLLDPETRELGVRFAVGIEPELWSKIRVPVGEGIAGGVAAQARAVRLSGRADPQVFHRLRERHDVAASLSVPLLHGGRVLGVLNLHHSERADAFSDDDLRFVEQVAALDAEIIVRVQDHERLRGEAARYRAVREARELLDSPDPLPRRLAALCRTLAGHIGRGVATIYLLEDEASELRLAATSLPGGGLGGDYRLALGEGVDGRAARDRAPAFLVAAPGCLAYAALPLLWSEELVGVLALQCGPETPDSREERDRLREVASAAAEAIGKARVEARISVRATKASAINETGLRLISTLEPAEVIRLATSSAALVLEADHAVLRLQDEESGRYGIRSYFGSADARVQERLFALDKEVSVTVIKRRAPLLVRHLASETPFRALADDFRSSLAAPLRRDGRVIGTLALYDKVTPETFDTASFTKDDLELFERFVGYVEKAIANAQFHVQVRRHRSVDEETELPEAPYLARRLDEELARSRSRAGSFAVAVCRIENLEAIERGPDPMRARRVIRRTAQALREGVRPFDLVARIAAGAFALLLPEPEPEVQEALADLARRVAEAVTGDASLGAGERPSLVFGYASYPEDATERDALLDRAAEPRIRQV